MFGRGEGDVWEGRWRVFWGSFHGYVDACWGDKWTVSGVVLRTSLGKSI